MRWFCILMLVSTSVWLAPDLGAMPPAGDSIEAPLCRDPSTTTPAPAPRCEIPAVPLAIGAPEFVESPVHIAVGAQRAVIDPTSGQLVPRRPTLELPRRRIDSFRVPHGALRQQRLPGGGWKLGLQGRMLTPLFATRGADGRPAPTHTWEPIDESPERIEAGTGDSR